MKLDAKCKKLEAVLEKLKADHKKLGAKYRQALDDKEKLKQRIMKLKMKNTSSVYTKLCKNCSQEYLESQNFNWSCRTHRVILYVVILYRANMGNRYGGVVEKLIKKHQDVNIQSI
jgi:hypothetical protein